MEDRARFHHAGSNLISQLSTHLVGRGEPQYSTALDALDESLREAIEGRRLLVLGAAGFIARQTLPILLRYEPSYVGVVDTSENGLAELIRSLRASDAIPPTTTIEPWLCDIGSPNFIRLARLLGRVDRVFNFAAIKHVRSERDIPSLLRMLEVNVLGVHASAKCIEEYFPGTPQFVVSTDKAADPGNFMGASKRTMEIALASLRIPFTTARFANVAFSSGSLLESWLIRLAEQQPLAVPEATWRYFLTPQEAGQLCAAASVAPARSAVVPQFTSPDLVLLEDALCTTLEFLGLEPLRSDGVEEARALIDQGVAGEGRYPYFVTPLDTAGEKTAERMLGVDEVAQPWQEGLDTMPMLGDEQGVTDLIDWLTAVIADPTLEITTDELGDRIREVVPNFSHEGGESRLDDRA